MNGTNLTLSALTALAVLSTSRRRGSSSTKGQSRWTYDVTYSEVWWPDGQDEYEEEHGYEKEDVELDLAEPDEVAKVLGLDEDYFDVRPKTWAQVPEWLKASVALGLVALDMGVTESHGTWWSTEPEQDMYTGHSKTLSLHPGNKKPGRRSLRGIRSDSGNDWPAELLDIVVELIAFEPLKPSWRRNGRTPTSPYEQGIENGYQRVLHKREQLRARLRQEAGLRPKRRGTRATMTPRIGQRVIVRQQVGSDVVWRMRIVEFDPGSFDEYIVLEDDAGATLSIPWYAWASEVLPYPGDVQWQRLPIVDEDLGTRRLGGSR